MKSKRKFYTMHKIEKTLIHHVVEWLATILSILGAIFVAFKYKEGFYIWIVANFLWISFAWKHKHYGLLLLSVSYLIINLIGIVRW